MFVVTKALKQSLDSLAGDPATGLFRHAFGLCVHDFCTEEGETVPTVCPENPLLELVENIHMIIFLVRSSSLPSTDCTSSHRQRQQPSSPASPARPVAHTRRRSGGMACSPSRPLPRRRRSLSAVVTARVLWWCAFWWLTHCAGDGLLTGGQVMMLFLRHIVHLLIRVHYQLRDFRHCEDVCLTQSPEDLAETVRRLAEKAGEGGGWCHRTAPQRALGAARWHWWYARLRAGFIHSLNTQHHGHGGAHGAAHGGAHSSAQHGGGHGSGHGAVHVLDADTLDFAAYLDAVRVALLRQRPIARSHRDATWRDGYI